MSEQNSNNSSIDTGSVDKTGNVAPKSTKRPIVSGGVFKLLKNLTQDRKEKVKKPIKINKKKAKEADEIAVNFKSPLVVPDSNQDYPFGSIFDFLRGVHPDMKNFYDNEQVRGYKANADGLTIYLPNSMRLEITPLQAKWKGGNRSWDTKFGKQSVWINHLQIERNRFRYRLIGKLKRKDRVIIDITDLPPADLK